MTWATLETAKRWPEGIPVLIQRMDRSVHDARGIEVVTWFRPDWVDHPHGYTPTDSIRFARLDKFLKAR